MSHYDNSNDLKKAAGDDYYTFLGISRDAAEKDIANAYRAMSKIYHPDKHPDDKKEAANILFNRTKKAYEVLKDPHKRAIYDTLGEQAIDNQMYQLVRTLKSPEEIRDSYKKLLKEKEEKQLKQYLNPRASVTVGINAINLFKKRRRRQRLKLSSMSLTAAIDVPVSHKNRLTVTGLVTSQNGVGEHAFTGTIKSAISEDINTEFQLTTGQNTFLKLKGVKTLNKQNLIGTSLVFSPELLGLFSKEINYVHLLSKYLAFNCALKSDLINESSLLTSLSYNKEKNKMDLEFQIGIRSSYLSLSYIRSLEINETKLKTKLRYHLITGASIDYGCETKLTKNSTIDAMMSFGNGVSLKLTVMVSNQAYSFDILLSDEVLFAPIVYGTGFPVLTYLCVMKYLIKPYQQSRLKQEKQEFSKENIKRMYEKRRDAELSIRLMQEVYERSIQSEQAKNSGLIIDLAIYGSSDNLQEFVNHNVRGVKSEDLNFNERFDLNAERLSLVTVPLQCLIKDSILYLPDATKSNLPGFYDTCPNREKKLYIRYKFRGSYKEIFCSDDDKLKLPN